jgi:BirA family biotin operon repressor/biotin-[acetyl-CoA-carboxylase] ligase
MDVLILRALFAQAPHYVSGEDLAAQAGVSRAAIWKHLDQLQKIGYPIEAQPHQGYRLLPPPNIWCADEIMARLPDSVRGAIPWRVLLFQETASTNDLVWREAQTGSEEGLVIIAEQQTAGRGRQGRQWQSSGRFGLSFSALLRPHWPLSQITRLTIVSSLAVADAVETLCGKKVQIKWPNDIFMSGKKLGGILTEVQADPEAIRFAIVGIGLNVTQQCQDFPPALREIATSLRNETGQEYRRADLLVEILTNLQERYREPFNMVSQAWSDRCFSLGQTISVQTPAGRQTGQAVGLDENGALLLRKEGGRVMAITAGDILP